MRGAANLAHRDAVETTLGKLQFRFPQQPLARFPIRTAVAHNVRLNNQVAAPIVTIEKISRNPRS